MPQNVDTTMQGRGDRPELIVLAKREANLRALGARVASSTGADTTSLNALLASHGASMQPLFALSEDRLHVQVQSLVTPLAEEALAAAERCWTCRTFTE